jgi:hypothetical protein
VWLCEKLGVVFWVKIIKDFHQSISVYQKNQQWNGKGEIDAYFDEIGITIPRKKLAGYLLHKL